MLRPGKNTHRSGCWFEQGADYSPPERTHSRRRRRNAVTEMMNAPMMNIFPTMPKKMEPVPKSENTTPMHTAQSATSIA